jgi:capsular exopolysaccharide synthesis family protein
MYLYHWPLFVIALMLAAGGLFLYAKMVNPVYEIRASFFIQDEKKRSDERSPLHEIDLVSSFRIIDNELEILKSKQLIGQVIKDLQLDVNYQKTDGLSAVDLYKSSPVKLTLIKPSGDYEKGKVKLVIKDKNSFLLEMPDGEMKAFLFKTQITNSFGVWMLEPTAELEKYLGEHIRIIISDPNKLAIAYQNQISASLTNKLSTTVVLSVKDQHPQRGMDILARLIYNYSLAGVIAKKRESQSTLDFIDDRLASLSGELSSAEKGIEVFKSSRRLTDISTDSRISLENMQINDKELNEINVKLSIIDGIAAYVNSTENLGKAPATLGIQDPALSSLIERLAILQLQRDRLLATTPETNPDFEPINRQIATTKAAIKENVGTIKASLEGVRDKLQTINKRFDSSIKNIPVQERQYISIKRQQGIKESLYTYLLQKREEISVSYAAAQANDRTVDQPYAISPKGVTMYFGFLAAFLFSFGAPIGLVFIRDFFSSKIMDMSEVESAVNIPVIGELPYQSGKSSIAVDEIHSTVIGEQFRALRISLSSLPTEKQHARVTLITSGLPGEGKSFVSSNLAVTLALSARKTIILELDMRKPKMAATFNLDPEHAGISEFLRGKATLKEITQHSAIEEELHLITSGAMVKNPAELLERAELRELINSLRGSYDHIIIDSPPVHLVPDATVLAGLTDVTLYVIRQGQTEKSELEFLRKLNRKKLLSNIQIVFNGVQFAKYGYGYNYNASYYTQNKGGSIFSDFWHRF